LKLLGWGEIEADLGDRKVAETSPETFFLYARLATRFIIEAKFIPTQFTHGKVSSYL